MSGSRYFSGEGPERPHLAKGEVMDLRNDVEAAFLLVQAEVSGGPLIVDMEDAADVTGGGTTRVVGFQVKMGVTPLTSPVLVEFAVFDDDKFSVPAVSAVLGTATVGTIIAGEGTAALKVLTDATGSFRCTLTDPSDEAVYIACSSTFGGPAVDCRDTDSVTFSA